jgi:hypothetical protein
MSRSDNRSGPDRDSQVSNKGAAGAASTDVSMPEDGIWALRLRQGLQQSNGETGNKLTSSWARSYRAFANQHVNNSKYSSFQFRKRSKLFKPKTRVAVRKNDAAAASSLFSTEDVVEITAEQASDKLSATTARFVHEVLNYRLDRSNRWAGPNWFLTAIGARQDSQITGICVSKQHWEYEERRRVEKTKVPMAVPMQDEMGQPVLDEQGMQVIQHGEDMQDVEKVDVIRDRLMITLIPAEQAIIDVSGDWRDPIQEGGFFYCAYPVRKDDVKHIVRQQASRHPLGGGQWRDIDVEAVFSNPGSSTQQADMVRRARSDGSDRYQSSMGSPDDKTVWLYECFYRVDGEDMHWWMLGDTIVLSDPKPTIEAYPEQFGSRPYVRGLGALETHKTHPMSPVESWQPLQQEINETTNLRLDAMKMAISPITKVRKGRGVDLKQVQNRGPDATVLVQDMDDVAFDRAPDPSSNSIMDINALATDLDDLAGVFSGSSVSQNRQLNETVGGMQMLNQSASSLTEFDLRVWVETWVEPVLAQCVNLIQYYEADTNVIKIAGEKAGLIANLTEQGLDPQGVAEQAAEQTAGMGHNGGPPLGGPPMPPEAQGAPAGPQAPPQPPPVPSEPPITIDQVLGHLDKAQLQVKINVGLGSMNSGERMQKLGMIMQQVMPLIPLMQSQGYDMNGPAYMQEVFGIGGYKDADRFWIRKKQEDPGPPPEVMLKQMELQAKAEETDKELGVEAKIAQMKADLEQQRIDLEKEKTEWEQLHGVSMMHQSFANDARDDMRGDQEYGMKLAGFDRDTAMNQHQITMDMMPEDTDPPEEREPVNEEPPVDKLGEMMMQMQQANQAMMQMLQAQQQAQAEQNAMLAKQLAAMAEASSAPVVFDRDPSGRLIGGRKNIQKEPK